MAQHVKPWFVMAASEVGTLVQVLPALLAVQPLANVPGRAVHDGLSAWGPATQVRVLVGVLGDGALAWASLSHCGCLRTDTEFGSSLSLTPHFSYKQLNLKGNQCLWYH